MEGFNECLQALKNGKTADVDVQIITNALTNGEPKLVDRLQYALYELCISEKASEVPADFVQQLVDICYNPTNLDAIKAMDQLVGCVASIIMFFVRKGEFTRAVELSKVLDRKSKELKKSLARSNVAKDNLLIVHNCLLQISVKQSSTNPELAISLFLKSLTPLQHITAEDQKLFRKVQKNLMIAFRSFQTYNGKLRLCVEKASEVLRRLSGRADVNYWFLDIITLKVCYTVTSKCTPEMLELIHAKWNEEITEILRMTNLSKLDDHWITVIDFCTKNLPNLQDFLIAVEKILTQSGREEKKRACLLLTALFVPELMGSFSATLTTENLELLYDHFIVKIYEALPEFKKYSVRSDKWHVCQLETFSKACLTLIHLFRLNLKRCAPKCIALIPVMVSTFKLATNCLDEMVNNSCGTEMRAPLWAQFVVRIANSIEDVMAICSTNNRWDPLRDICGCLVPMIAKSSIPLPIERSRLTGMFERWYFACLKMNNIVGALLARATQIWLCPWDIDWAMMSWVKTKLREKRLTGYIFCDFLKLYDKDFSADGVKTDAKDFFLAELRAYSSVPSVDNDDPMIRIWAAFKLLKPSLFESAYALSCLTVGLVQDVTPALTNQYIMECRQHLTELSKIKVEQPKSKVKAMVYEGLLKFALFSCYVRQSRQKGPGSEARNVVLNLLKAEANEKAKFGEDVDGNLTCDVLPHSPLLTVTEEAHMLAAVSQALAAWALVPDAWTPNCLLDFEVNVSLEHIRLIATTGALFGDLRLTCKAWVLYYRIAHLVSDNIAELLAMSMLIKECGLPSASKLVSMAKQCSEKIENVEIKKMDQAKIEVLMIFRLVLAESYLMSNDYHSAADILKGCQEYIRNLRSETEYQMLRGWYLCEVSKVLFVAPEMGDILETRYVQRAAYNAFTSLKCALKIGTERSLTTKQQGQLLVTMLDVSLWCSDIFFVFLLTPYVRAFLEDLYVTCQNLGLTSRTAQLLTLLVQVDLTAKALTDAQQKLTTLSSMLELSPLAIKEGAKTTAKTGTLSPALLGQLSPLRCEPQPQCNISKSPLPLMLPNKVQNTRKHVDSCSCYTCTNGFLQLLTVTTRSCEAVAAALAGDNKTAHLYHKHCDNLINNFNIDKYCAILCEELAVAFPGETPFSIQKKFCVVAARAKLNYSAFALMPDSHCGELSLKLLRETDQIISGLTFQKNLIEWECLELITCDHVFEESLRDRSDFKDAFEEVYKQTYDIATTLAKTPHVSRKPLEMAETVEPLECMDTDAPAPKRGRRIFEEIKPKMTAGEPDDISSGAHEKTPVDSDNEIPGTPSPEVKSTYRSTRARQARRLKPAPLIFDDYEDKNGGNLSNDIFESFNALRIPEPAAEKKKTTTTTTSKKTGKKKDASTAKKKSTKTARL